ncbi:MAG: PIG-L deacetylase family protein [Planctomycetota bacterium]
MIRLANIAKLRRVLVIGAHSDDPEIGCGATLIRLLRDVPDLVVRFDILCGRDMRGDEAVASANKLFDGREGCEIVTHDFHDAHLPADWSNVKLAVSATRPFEPDLVLTHRPDDAHQDHRLLGEVVGQTFRDHLIYHFEIAKYDGDLGQPNVFAPATKEDVDAKCRLLDTFVSQRDKHWFDDETFKGLMRLRGLECASPTGYAEAFHCRKALL